MLRLTRPAVRIAELKTSPDAPDSRVRSRSKNAAPCLTRGAVGAALAPALRGDGLTAPRLTGAARFRGGVFVSPPRRGEAMGDIVGENGKGPAWGKRDLSTEEPRCLGEHRGGF